MNKTFIFWDDFEKDISCETQIKVEDTISNNSPVYIIEYIHKINKNGNSNIIKSIQDVVKPCPFAYYREDIKSTYNGVIVIKNAMTEQMIKFLLMDDDELAKYTGCTTPQHYRKNILVHITNFWD